MGQHILKSIFLLIIFTEAAVLAQNIIPNLLDIKIEQADAVI